MKKIKTALSLALLILAASCGSYEGHQYDKMHKASLPETFEGWEIDLSEKNFDLKISRSKEGQIPTMGVWGYDGYNLTEQAWGFTLYRLLENHYYDLPIYLENPPELPRMDFYYETKYPHKGEGDNDMAKKELANNLRPLLSKVFNYSTEVKTIPMTVTTITLGDEQKAESLILPDNIHDEEIFKGSWQLSDFLNLIEQFADRTGYVPDNLTNSLNKTTNRINELFIDKTGFLNSNNQPFVNFPIPVEAFADLSILKEQLRDWGFILTEEVVEKEVLAFTFNE